MKLAFLIFFLTIANHSSSNELKKFETDNCTLFTEGTTTKPNLWKHCCIMHDLKYWIGGSIISRNKADLDLKNCVKIVAGVKWAELIYNGVKIGHHSPIKNKYNWSWGWRQKRSLEDFNHEEESYVILKLYELKSETPYIEQVISEYFNN